MIGFKLSATGSHGFNLKSEAWSEGDIWIGQALNAVKSPLKKGQEMAIEAIEGEFKKIGQNMFWTYVINFGMNLHLIVKGDLNFMYRFQASKPADQIARELLKKIDDQNEQMGDQVTLHFANCFKNFQLHVVTRDTNDLKLIIDINL